MLRLAPCVSFTEIDIEALDDQVIRKLFVGVARAIKLKFIFSERKVQPRWLHQTPPSRMFEIVM